MKTSTIFSLFICSLTLTFFAAAADSGREGGGVSGGGNVVVCFDDPAVAAKVLAANEPISDEILANNVVSIETLDLLQARNSNLGIDHLDRPAPLNLPLEAEQNSEYLRRLAQELEGISELRGFLLGAVALMEKNTFLQTDSRIEPGVKQIRDVGDLPYVLAPNRCILTTAAVQTQIDVGYRWDFDQRILLHPKFSRDSQAVLFLHEAVYWIDRQLNHAESSATTRDIVGILLRLNTYTVAALRETLQLSLFKNRYAGEITPSHFGYPRWLGWNLTQAPTPDTYRDFEIGPHRLRMAVYDLSCYSQQKTKCHPIYEKLFSIYDAHGAREIAAATLAFKNSLIDTVEREFNLPWVPAEVQAGAREFTAQWIRANPKPQPKDLQKFAADFNLKFAFDPLITVRESR